MNDLTEFEQACLLITEKLGSGIKSLTVNMEMDLWTVEYYGDLPPDEMVLDDLEEFLMNG